MGILQGIRSNYSLFGPHGLFLAAKSRLSQRPVEIIVSVPGIKHPLHLRLRTSDISLFAEILLNAEYDYNFPKRPQVIVDAGANIGLATVFYANKYPDAKIIAIEPEPSNYEMLKKNVAPHSTVVPVLGALWKEDKELSLVDPGLGRWGFQTRDQGTSNNLPNLGQVPGLTLDSLMLGLGLEYIDILKVDIEGAEVELFESSLRWIDKVGVIVIELHDRFRTGCSRGFYLATRDFEFEWRRGETTIMARRQYVPADASRARISKTPSGSSPHRRGLQLPCKIIRAA
jgi:FkbM family methyltransferase